MSEPKMPIASMTRKDVTRRMHRKGIWEGKYRLRIFCTETDKCIFYNTEEQRLEDKWVPFVLYMPDIHANYQRLIVNDDACDVYDFHTWVELSDRYVEDDFMDESEEAKFKELDEKFGDYWEVVPDNAYASFSYDCLYSLFDRQAFGDFEDEASNEQAESPFSLFNCRRQDFDVFCIGCKEYNSRNCACDDLKRGRCLTIWSQCEIEKLYDNLMKIRSTMK